MQKELVITEGIKNWRMRYKQLGKMLGKLGNLEMNNWGKSCRQVEKTSTNNKFI